MMLGVNKLLLSQVSYLSRYAEEDDDHKGVLTPLLQRLHHYSFEIRKQGMSHLPQEARFQAIPTTGSKL